jgi:predicted Rossmann-fold nucleotide-binding protein
MGVLADAVLAEGGDVTGVIPESLVREEIARHELTDLRVVASMHERKATMA